MIILKSLLAILLNNTQRLHVKMKEKIAFWLLKSSMERHARIARRLYWLKSTVDESWGAPEKVEQEKKLLHAKAKKHESFARTIQRIIHIYNASKSI